MSDIGLHWNAFDLALIALLACSPGLVAGLLLGAVVWRDHRVIGAALGGAIGAVLCVLLLMFCFRSRIALADGFDGAAWLTLKVCWPGFVLGGMIAAWRFGERWIVAALCGAPMGAVAWLGVWSYFF
ncbi:Ca2+/Na+ antiporter [Nitrobacteraceae bacterium AZCC 2146]